MNGEHSGNGSAAPRPLRILIATDTYPPDVNGASYFTGRLAAGLAERGHDVRVVCPSHQGTPVKERSGDVQVYRLRSLPLLVHSTMRAAVPAGVSAHAERIVQAVDPDVVHAQGHFTVGRATLRAARRAGIPAVLTNHFMPENLYDYVRMPRRIQPAVGALAWGDLVRVARSADHVTTPTVRAARLLGRHGLRRRVEAVSCGIDLSRFQSRPEERTRARERLGLPDRPTVLFVGRLDAEKRVGDLILGLSRLGPDSPAQLAVVGTGKHHDRLRGLARGAGVDDRVHFLGFVPDEELPWAYTAADMFAIAGVAELQSIVTLEAMASGLPVLAADAMALPHLVRTGDNGFLFPPGDVEEIAGKMDLLLQEPATRERLGERSRHIAMRHDHSATLDRFEAIYAGRYDSDVPARERRAPEPAGTA